MVEALNFGHQSIQPLIDIQEQMVREIGKPKQPYVSFNVAEAVQTTVNQRVASQMNEILVTPHTKAEMDSAINALRQEIVTELTAEDEGLAPNVMEAFDESLKSVVRQRILDKQIRPDG